MARASGLILALVCGALGAQGHEAQPRASVDVHGLELATSGGELVPRLRIVRSERVTVEPDGRRVVAQSFGDARLVVELTLDARNNSAIEGLGLRVTDPYRFGRAPRRGTRVRGAMLAEAVADPSQPFVPLDVRAFLRRAADMLLTEEEWPKEAGGAPRHLFDFFGGGRWNAALLLGSVPLREYLDPARIDGILASESRSVEDRFEESPVYLRPLIALGERRVLTSRTLFPE